MKFRVDSRLQECDNYAFLAVLVPNFKFPAGLLPQNAKIWRSSSNPVRILVLLFVYRSLYSIPFG